MPTSSDKNNFDPIWHLLLAVASLRKTAQLPSLASGFTLDDNAALTIIAADDDNAQLLWHPTTGLKPGPALTDSQWQRASLYCPVAAGPADKIFAVAHLGQSLDAQIATATGDSYYVTGPENLQHLHRLRALCDAIVVGSNTVHHDNPRLTTRLVAGPNPVRIILDPSARLPVTHQVFSADATPSLRIVADQVGATIAPSVRDDPRTVMIASETKMIEPALIRKTLADRGHRVLFIEGGGRTISAWLESGELDRLQLACAPLLVGAGIASVQYPPAQVMQNAMRAPCGIYQMGSDIMWDFALGERQADRSDDVSADVTANVFRRLV